MPPRLLGNRSQSFSTSALASCYKEIHNYILIVIKIREGKKGKEREGKGGSTFNW